MKQFLPALILTVFLGCSPSKTDGPRGHLIIIGGGSPRPQQVMQKFVELAGSNDAVIGVIPMASENYQNAAKRYQQEFLGYGVSEVRALIIKDSLQASSDSILSALEGCSGYFFGGGDQNRLTAIFNNTEALKLLHRKYQEGAVIGGTSAGAAIMSRVMITGDGDWSELKPDTVEYTTGFGFIQNAIIDQHFIERSRFNRLLAMVIEHRLPGIGIDRLTAVWVKPGGEMEVMGERVVLVIQPGRDSFPEKIAEDRLTASNLRLDIYEAGKRFRIEN